LFSKASCLVQHLLSHNVDASIGLYYQFSLYRIFKSTGLWTAWYAQFKQGSDKCD
jgi:hypothetical protein